jgi:cytochrome c
VVALGLAIVRPLAVVALGVAIVRPLAADAQMSQSPAPRQRPSSAHGDPRGWTFKLPPGADAARGRAVFEKLECYKCHELKGAKFPAPSQRDSIGPELSSMASHHSEGFLAESIVNPNAFIDKGQPYTATDGTSKMPSFNDSLTVQDLIDLVAFLKGLSPPAAPRQHRH